MNKFLTISALSLMQMSMAQATETYLCTATPNLSLIPTQVQIVIEGNQVSGKLDFNFDGVTRSWARFGANPNNDFTLRFANLDSEQKEIVFSKDDYDHYTYDLVFSSHQAVLKQTVQLDCTNPAYSRAFMTCEKK